MNKTIKFLNIRENFIQSYICIPPGEWKDDPKGVLLLQSIKMKSENYFKLERRIQSIKNRQKDDAIRRMVQLYKTTLNELNIDGCIGIKAVLSEWGIFEEDFTSF